MTNPDPVRPGQKTARNESGSGCVIAILLALVTPFLFFGLCTIAINASWLIVALLFALVAVFVLLAWLGGRGAQPMVRHPYDDSK